MMKKCVWLVVALLVTMGLTANVQAVIITFDDMGFAAHDDVTSQYAGLGVIFEGYEDGNMVNLEAADETLFGDVNPQSEPTALSNFYNDSSGLRADIMSMIFTTPADSVSFYYNGAGLEGANTVFSVYDGVGGLLTSFTVPEANDSSMHLVTVGVDSVGRIDVAQPTEAWGHYIDDLSFTPGQAVPDLGSTLLLSSLSLGILAGVRRKWAA